MRLVSLNTWGGIVFEPLMEFVRRHAADTDMFCFQEMFFGSRPEDGVEDAKGNGRTHGDLCKELEMALPDHVAYPRYAPEGSQFQGEKPPAGVRLGQVIFVKRGIPVTDQGGFYTYPDDSPVVAQMYIRLTGNFQYVRVRSSHYEYLVGSVHGLWQPGGKRDTPERLAQSRILADFFKKGSGKKILCGDLNLHPDTESIAILGGEMRNLIAEYGIGATRTSFYADKERLHDPIADYAFVSSDVDVRRFAVLGDEVSDHSPLLLEFD
jgi:hypothetical protein